MHVDADEIRLPPSPFATIPDAVAAADAEGFNAIDFMEFAFVPTLEDPDHDHDRFQETMRWYYPFRPSATNRLNLWKRQPGPVDLVASGGHRVSFPGLRLWHRVLPMRHYLFLSLAHVREKWIDRVFDPSELAQGWHRARASLRMADIALQSRNALREYRSDDALDDSNPLTFHPVFSRTSQPAPSEVAGSGPTGDGTDGVS
jgi:hypothetical protein